MLMTEELLFMSWRMKSHFIWKHTCIFLQIVNGARQEELESI